MANEIDHAFGEHLEQQSSLLSQMLILWAKYGIMHSHGLLETSLTAR